MIGGTLRYYNGKAEGMGAERGVVLRKPPSPLTFGKEDQRMRADTFLRAMGQALSKGLRGAGVPHLLVDQWLEAWALMVVDVSEEGEDVDQLVIRVVQALTAARDLSRTYGCG